MKQKPDEFPDNWVRQTLNQLPDSPPPGSSFDSERLWGHLRTELQPAPSRRLIGLMWWVAAACLTGLTLGWFWLHQATSDPIGIATYGNKHKAEASITSRHSPNLTDEIARSKSVVSEKEKPVPITRMHGHQKEVPKVESTPQVTEPIEVVIQTLELPTVAEVSPVVEKRLELPKPNIAAAPKRRFKVVHENELRAEEETRPKLYRTENFVRIGTGARTESPSDESRPALTLPLTHKPNQ